MYEDAYGRTLWNNKGAAALCHVGPNLMLRWLREKNIYTPQNVPKRALESYGYWVVKMGERHPVPTTYWTESGLTWLRDMTTLAIQQGTLKEIPFKPGDDMEVI